MGETGRRLEGRVALVTGASSGIGRGVAIAFGREGARVAVNYPTPEQADAATEVCAAIRDTGGEAVAVEADVSDDGAVGRMIDAVRGAFGPVEILVNNAGIAHAGSMEEIAVEMWDRVIAVHLRGAFLTTRRVLPDMYAAGWGRIISTASQLAYKGAAGFTHYTAAKGALVSMSRSLALEAGDRGVTVNCVAPGTTLTPMLEEVPDEILNAIRAEIPLGRLAEVDDIVPTYVMLASDEGRHYHGQTLSPNGGDVFL